MSTAGNSGSIGPDASFTGNTYIVPARDKLLVDELELAQALEKFAQNCVARSSWQIPASLCLSVLLALVSAKFRDFGIPNMGVFLTALASFAAVAFAAVALFRWLRIRRISPQTAASIIEGLKERAAMFPKTKVQDETASESTRTFMVANRI